MTYLADHDDSRPSKQPFTDTPGLAFPFMTSSPGGVPASMNSSCTAGFPPVSMAYLPVQIPQALALANYVNFTQNLVPNSFSRDYKHVPLQTLDNTHAQLCLMPRTGAMDIHHAFRIQNSSEMDPRLWYSYYKSSYGDTACMDNSVFNERESNTLDKDLSRRTCDDTFGEQKSELPSEHEGALNLCKS